MTINSFQKSVAGLYLPQIKANHETLRLQALHIGNLISYAFIRKLVMAGYSEDKLEKITALGLMYCYLCLLSEVYNLPAIISKESKPLPEAVGDLLGHLLLDRNHVAYKATNIEGTDHTKYFQHNNLSELQDKMSIVFKSLHDFAIKEKLVVDKILESFLNVSQKKERGEISHG
jgi:hypothetical protein